MAETIVEPSRTRAERDAEALKKQLAIYSEADGPIWRYAVYDELHGGWDLASLGGRPFLDHMIDVGHIGVESTVLELGSGAGAACRYVVEGTGCQVVGIDINLDQVARATRRAASVRSGSMSFSCGDLTKLQTQRPNDVVFQLDTFSLLPSMAPAILSARGAVKPAGCFFMADLVAGETFDHETAERAWTLDGFSSLLSVEHIRSLLASAGFTQVEVRDQTDDAIVSIEAILRRLSADSAPASIPRAQLQEWHALMSWYRTKFRERALGYCWWVAKP